LDTLGKGKKSLLVEKEELQDLKDEMADYKEVIINKATGNASIYKFLKPGFGGFEQGQRGHQNC